MLSSRIYSFGVRQTVNKLYTQNRIIYYDFQFHWAGAHEPVPKHFDSVPLCKQLLLAQQFHRKPTAGNFI